MNILSWILFGLIVGIVANAMDDASKENNVVTTTTLGIIGAVLGGLFSSVLFSENMPGFSLPSFIVAVAGSLILLVSVKALQKF